MPDILIAILSTSVGAAVVTGIMSIILYKVKNGGEHTTQTDWTPDLARSLFEKICESASGTLDDPIPYSSGMVLEEGKYYAESGVVYRYFRGSGTAVYHALRELMGLYVEHAEEG